jgi:hypothetical protein
MQTEQRLTGEHPRDSVPSNIPTGRYAHQVVKMALKHCVVICSRVMAKA